MDRKCCNCTHIVAADVAMDVTADVAGGGDVYAKMPTTNRAKKGVYSLRDLQMGFIDFT